MIIGTDIREWQPGHRTGIGRFLEEFLRAATPVRPQDRFLLVGNETSEVRIQTGNADIVRIPERWTPWWDQVALPRVLVQHGAAVFYSPYIKVPLLASVPVVSTIHDLTFFVRPGNDRRWADWWVHPPFRLFCALVARRAAAIIVDSETSARDVQRLLRPDPAKVHIVPLATSGAFRAEADPRADAAVWNRYGLAHGYVLYVGGFRPHKNVPRLIRAHAALPASLRARHPLVLAGGPIPAELQSRLSEPEVAAGTRAIGVVPDADLPALYRGAGLFAFPSHYEGFGLPVLEAMACRTPVLCSTAPALVELTGNAAHHADPEDDGAWRDALIGLLEDPGRRAAFAARGAARSAGFSPERMAAEILRALDGVVGCPR